MISTDEFQAFADLDLEPIKVKLMHEESGEGWSLEKVNAVEFEYRRFLFLMKRFPTEETAPLMDVDIFWHYHILDTLKYATDCEQLFGYFLHHFPYIGLRGEADEQAHQRVGERMRELYEATFGEAYIRMPAQAAQAGATAFSGMAVTPAFSGMAVGNAPAKSAARTAFSGMAVKPAFSGMAVGQGVAARTAFSGMAVKTAFSGMAVKTAFSGMAVGKETGTVAAKSAFSGMAVNPAFSGMAVDAGKSAAPATPAKPAEAGMSHFYTERPRLAAN